MLPDALRRVGRFLRWAVGRVLVLAFVALLVSAATFFLLRVTREPVSVVAALRGLDPSDPAVRSDLAAELGTDRNLVVQYADWLSGAVRGDLGNSYDLSRQPVWPMLRKGLAFNIELTALSQLVALAIAVPVGALAGSRVESLLDRGLRMSTVAVLSAPPYVVAVLLITVFASKLGWFPVTAARRPDLGDDLWGHLKAMALPTLAMAIPMAGIYARVLRSSVAVTLHSDFLTMARSKGLSTSTILRRHVVRPSAGPLVQLAGLQTAALLGGSILVEHVFAVSDGFGRTLVVAALSADTPVVLGVATAMAVIFTAVMTLVDGALRILDPRIADG